MRDILYSLRFRAILIAVLLLAVLFTLVVYNTNKLLHKVAEENINSNIRQTSETINLAISLYTTNDDLLVLNEYIQELISGREVSIVYLAIIDDRGEVILKTNTFPDILPTPTQRSDYATVDVVHLSQPTLLEGHRVGTLRYGMTWKQLHEGIDKVNQEVFVILAIGFIFIVILLFTLSLNLNSRITSLMLTSRKLGEGDYQVRAEETGKDELSILAHDFNAMAQAIEERIVELEKSRAEVETLNISLEQRVIERTSELATALSKLKKTQNELVQSEKLAGLGSIVAAVAHELNTPIGNALTVATSFADKSREFDKQLEEGLKRSSLNAFRDDIHAAVDLIERNLGKASELITSFKHVAIDQASSKRREFDLKITLGEVLSTIRPTFKKSGHVLEEDLQAGIAMDSFPGPLGQIITNFVNNALLHAFADIDRGVMKLGCALLDEHHVEIIFSDNGNGMSEDVKNQIFDPFFTTQLGTGGSGLGMHIVHNMVTGLLGGEINVSSTQGEGTVFRVVLPLVAPEHIDSEKEKIAYSSVES